MFFLVKGMVEVFRDSSEANERFAILEEVMF
jgi:hypothetical protein